MKTTLTPEEQLQFKLAAVKLILKVRQNLGYPEWDEVEEFITEDPDYFDQIWSQSGYQEIFGHYSELSSEQDIVLQMMWQMTTEVLDILKIA